MPFLTVIRRQVQKEEFACDRLTSPAPEKVTLKVLVGRWLAPTTLAFCQWCILPSNVSVDVIAGRRPALTGHQVSVALLAPHPGGAMIQLLGTAAPERSVRTTLLIREVGSTRVACRGKRPAHG